MFGFSFSELLMICVVALIAVGPKKLPGMLHSLGQFLRKMRNMTNDVRNQTGIDQLLRAEGLHGGLNELRGLLRINHGISFDSPQVSAPAPSPPVVNAEPNQLGMPAQLAITPVDDPYAHIDIDTTREYPPEGADAYGALPDDLLEYQASVAARAKEAAAQTLELAKTTEGAAVSEPAAPAELPTQAEVAAKPAQENQASPDATAETTTPSA